jgi:predicted TIM-barrel fold metal-dependent hydrolase
MSPADPRLEPYFALAEEFDLPVGIHLGLAPPRTPELCCPAYRTYLGRPHLLEDVLAKHPKLRVYIMHAGYPYAEETIALLHMYPGVHVDISAIAMQRAIPRGVFQGYLRRLTDAGFHGRVMYGSDYPGASAPTIESIDTAPFLTTEQKKDIFCRNAVRFFRLKNVSCD